MEERGRETNSGESANCQLVPALTRVHRNSPSTRACWRHIVGQKRTHRNATIKLHMPKLATFERPKGKAGRSNRGVVAAGNKLTSFLVAPILTATPKPCIISSVPSPRMCIPTISSSFPWQMSLKAVGCLAFSSFGNLLSRKLSKSGQGRRKLVDLHIVEHPGELCLIDLKVVFPILLFSLLLGQTCRADRGM